MNFPHCLGAIDGKHVAIKAPNSSGSYFFNYKGTHSIILLGIVDSYYKFIFVDVGCNGRVADGEVFYGTPVAKGLRRNSLSLPDSSSLPGRSEPVPYVFVADDAFPIQKHILKPYSYKSKVIT